MRKICGNSLLKQRSGFFVFGFLVAYLSCGLLPAAAWTDVDHAYRTADPASEDCQKLKQNPSALSGVNNDETRSIADPWWNCTIQRHENPPPIGSNSFAASTVRVIHDPSAYNLAFVEFGEEGQELNTNQRRLLFEHLQAQKQNYVVVFVHGWRDDAQRGNGNLMNFRMLLSYTKSALESRCVEAGRYCDATLTGVYIGWRGQALSEDGNDWWSSAKAAFTLFTRKPTSERIAGGVAAFLNDLSRTLDTRSASVSSMFARDHMLTIGHSLGGNVLITGFGPDILASINALKDARNLRAPAGDLIVLLNPAAEASKWTRLQDAVVSRGANLFAPNQTAVADSHLSLSGRGTASQGPSP